MNPAFFWGEWLGYISGVGCAARYPVHGYFENRETTLVIYIVSAASCPQIHRIPYRSRLERSWHGFDVVIASYQTLRFDLYAHPYPRCPRRTVVYEWPRNPLVMVEWKHVVMDEAMKFIVDTKPCSQLL